jgi:hypothetical protein
VGENCSKCRFFIFKRVCNGKDGLDGFAWVRMVGLLYDEDNGRNGKDGFAWVRMAELLTD